MNEFEQINRGMSAYMAYKPTHFDLVRQKGQAGGLKFDAGKDEWNLLLSGKGMIKALRGVFAEWTMPDFPSFRDCVTSS